MEDAQTGAALQRIDAALKRIEAAARRGGDRNAQADLAHLSARHESLREEARAAIAAIDHVIEGGPR